MEEAIALHCWKEATGTLLGLEKDDQWPAVKLREGLGPPSLEVGGC